jgi:hypothetical protein
MAVAAFESGAGFRPRRGINSKFQSFSVYIIGQRLHVWKLRVRMNEALRVAFRFPRVINVDVHVSRVPHSARDHRVSLCPHGRVIDFFCEMIPTVPSHWRCSGDRRRLRHTLWSYQERQQRKQSGKQLPAGQRVAEIGSHDPSLFSVRRLRSCSTRTIHLQHRLDNAQFYTNQ